MVLCILYTFISELNTELHVPRNHHSIANAWYVIAVVNDFAGFYQKPTSQKSTETTL